jgi:hypothetical protein
VTERLWRLRKRQHVIDAMLRENDSHSVALEYLMNGQRLTVRQCATRVQAMAAAAEKRSELERAGWASHW